MLSQCQVRMRQLSWRPVTASGHGGRPVDSCPADKPDLRSNLGPPMPKASNRPASPPPQFGHRGSRAGGGHPYRRPPSRMHGRARRGSRILITCTDHGDHHSQESRTSTPITATNSNVTSVISRREKPSRRDRSTEPNCQVAHSPVAADVRRNRRRRWARRHGRIRGEETWAWRVALMVQASGCFLGRGYFRWEGGSSGAVQCSAVHLDLAVGVSPTCRKMHVRWALGKQRDPMEGGKRHHSLPYRKSGRVVVVVLGRLGLISLAGGER